MHYRHFLLAPLLLSTCLLSGYTLANEADSIHDAFAKGTIKGLIRYNGYYRDTSLKLLQDSTASNISDQKKQQYSAFGGYLGFETAPLFDTTVGATFYSANAVGHNPDNRKGLGGLDESKGGQDSFSVLGEAYIKYQTEEHRLAFGRKEMPDYRFVSLSNVRMTPITHEGTTYQNTSIDGLKIDLAYLTKQKDRNATQFVDMVRAAKVSTGCGALNTDGSCVNSGNKKLLRGDYDARDFDSSGNYTGENKAMPMVGGSYSKGGLSLEVWDYYAIDFVNTLYLHGQYDYQASDTMKLTAAAQYAEQDDVGDHVAGNIDTWFYGLKLQATLSSGMTFFASHNEVDYNEKSYDGGTIFVRWGSPQMFNSFQTQDSELAGTKSYGIGAQFELGKLGLVPNTMVRVRHASHNLPDSIYQADARQDRTETTLDLRYAFGKNDGFGLMSPIQGLSLLLRIAYVDYETNYDYAAFQAQNGYSFSAVNDDFFDTRLYLDYVF